MNFLHSFYLRNFFHIYKIKVLNSISIYDHLSKYDGIFNTIKAVNIYARFIYKMNVKKSYNLFVIPIEKHGLVDFSAIKTVHVNVNPYALFGGAEKIDGATHTKTRLPFTWRYVSLYILKPIVIYQHHQSNAWMESVFSLSERCS